LWSDGGRPVAAAMNGERWGFPEVMDRAIEAASGHGSDGIKMTVDRPSRRPLFALTGFRTHRARHVLATIRLPAAGGDRGILAILGGDDDPPPDTESLCLLGPLAAAAGGLADRLSVSGPWAASTSRPANGIVERDASAERRRIARELHDGLIQSLYGTGLLIRAHVNRTDIPIRARDTMRTWVERIDRVIDEARDYVDQLEESRDAVAELGSGLDAIAEEAVATGLDVSTEVTATEHVRPSADVRRELLQVAHEAVSNVIRHAAARKVGLRVEMDPATDLVQLTVEDDGNGFDPAGGLPTGHGLRNMMSRAIALGGDLDVVSRPGAGTRVRLRVRLGSRSRPPGVIQA
jgi:signal transduction histidine kinase